MKLWEAVESSAVTHTYEGCGPDNRWSENPRSVLVVSWDEVTCTKCVRRGLTLLTWTEFPRRAARRLGIDLGEE